MKKSNDLLAWICKLHPSYDNENRLRKTIVESKSPRAREKTHNGERISENSPSHSYRANNIRVHHVTPERAKTGGHYP